MIYASFPNTNDTFFIYLLSILSFVLFLVYIIFQSHYGKHIRNNELKYMTNNSYEFIFNLKTNEVTFFKKYEAQNVKTEKLKDFYKRILDQRKLTMFKNWVNDLSNNVDRTLQSEIDVLISEDEIASIYFYELTESSNPNIIHIEGKTVFKKQNISNGNSSKLGISVDTAFLRKHKNTGYMIYLRLMPCTKNVPQEKAALALKLVNHIFVSFYNESNLRLKLNASINEYNLALIDYTEQTPDDYGEVINAFAKRISDELSLNNLDKLMNFVIGVGRCDEYQAPYDLLADLKNLTYANIESENHVEWFFRSQESTIEKTIEARKEIETFLSGRKVKGNTKILSLFSPLVNLGSAKLYGFMTHSVPYNTSFKNLNQFFSYAEELDLAEEVCSTMMKRIVNVYYNEYAKLNISIKGRKMDTRLFLQLNRFDFKYMLDYIDNIRYLKSCNPVFVISENLLNEIAGKNITNAFNFLQSLKNKNFELCLSIKDRAFPWPDSIYEKFDYYLFDMNIVKKRKVDFAASTGIKAVFNKLETFEKPFIAINVENKTQYRILSEKGVKLLSGDYFGKESENISLPNLVRIAKLKIN